MPDFQLIAKPACPPDADSQIGEYAVLEVPLAIVSVATFDLGKGDSKLSEFLEVDPPDVAKWVENGSRSAFWTAPSQWFVISDESGSSTLFNDISNALGGDAAITDQSGGWACFDVTGPNLIAVLEKLVGFDVASAQAGEAHRTSIEHIGSFVLCRSGDAVRILCPRSYARSLHHALTQAVRSQLAFDEYSVS